MKKQDLNNGDIVLDRNGDKYIVLKNSKYYGGKTDIIVDLRNTQFLVLKEYNNDLTFCNGETEYDIMAVCSNNYVGDNIRDHIINNEEEKWTWKRQEVKEMTLAEISEALGYEVKVVKEEK